MSESLFNKVAGLHLASLLKKTLVQVFSCEVCNTLFTEHLRRLLLFYQRKLNHCEKLNYSWKKFAIYYLSEENRKIRTKRMQVPLGRLFVVWGYVILTHHFQCTKKMFSKINLFLKFNNLII